MADTTTQQATANDEAQALAAAQAGYDRKARGTTPPAESSASVAESSLSDQVQTPPQETPAPGSAEPDPQAATAQKPDPIAAVTEQLGALRATVQELASQGGDVRKLHGEIGNINRTLKKLEAAKAADAPAAEDELAAALKQAESVAQEYPEIGAPFVKALQALSAKVATNQLARAEPDAADQPTAPAVDMEQMRARERQQAAIDAINELHPDRLAINEQPEFKTWLAAKPPEFQKAFKTTWNPAVLSKGYDEFKASQLAKKRRQDRLEAATQPQGTGSSAPTTITDEQAARLGYQQARKRRFA